MSAVLGIDPGLHGAWAIVSEDGQLQVAFDFPLIGARKQMRIDGGGLAHTWRERSFGRVVIETVHSMPEQGVASSFRFGYAAGQILGIIETFDIPIVWTTPARWKREMRVSADKEESRRRAIELWPHERYRFSLKRHHGRAEAALLALWGAQQRLGKEAA